MLCCSLTNLFGYFKHSEKHIYIQSFTVVYWWNNLLSAAKKRGKLVLKTGILDHFHGDNPSIQARGHKEWAHPQQQPQEMITDAHSKCAADLSILGLKVTYWSEGEFCHFVKHKVPLQKWWEAPIWYEFVLDNYRQNMKCLTREHVLNSPRETIRERCLALDCI